jgi:hypothetical protein
MMVERCLIDQKTMSKAMVWPMRYCRTIMFPAFPIGVWLIEHDTIEKDVEAAARCISISGLNAKYER